jgi:hypothetical protein
MLPCVVLDFTWSALPFARLMPGTIKSSQLHRMPCHAYFSTLVLHFGHSSRPSSLLCSSSGRIQERGSTKQCEQAVDVVVLSELDAVV